MFNFPFTHNYDFIAAVLEFSCNFPWGGYNSLEKDVSAIYYLCYVLPPNIRRPDLWYPLKYCPGWPQGDTFIPVGRNNRWWLVSCLKMPPDLVGLCVFFLSRILWSFPTFVISLLLFTCISFSPPPPCVRVHVICLCSEPVCLALWSQRTCAPDPYTVTFGFYILIVCLVVCCRVVWRSIFVVRN